MRMSMFVVCAGLSVSFAQAGLAQSENVAAVAAPATGQYAAVSGGQSLQILVAQSEIKSDINLSNIAVATGGGLLGGLIGAAVDSARAKKAEELIGPVRNGLAGFDADALAIDAARKGFAGVAWLDPATEPKFSKDASPAGKLGMLDAGAGGQTAFVEYTYDMSPEFDAVRVVAKVDVARKAIPASAKGNGEKRLSPKNLAYSRSVTSVVTLTFASKEKEANASTWAADDSKLTRAALSQAFERVQMLTPRLLALTPTDVMALNNKKNKRIVAGGFTGRPQPSGSAATLLWTGTGFVEVSPLR